MQMLKNIFNSENKYYLELDETEESKPVETAVKTAVKAVETVVETAEKVVAPETSEPAQKIAKTTVKPDVSSSNGKQASSSSAVENKKQPEKKAKSSPKSAGASSFEPPFWVAAMYNTSTSTGDNSKSTAEQTFATDNLMPTITKYRRTAGPSLNKFKEMARKAKTPKG